MVRSAPKSHKLFCSPLILTLLLLVSLLGSAGAQSYVFELTFGSPVSGNNVAVDRNGNVFAGDNLRNQVQKFDNNGNFLIQFGSSGTGPGQFSDASGVAVDSNGNVYVTDSNNNRVQKFDNNGNFLIQFGRSGTGPGLFSFPEGVAVDSNGNVFVNDQGNNRVQKFDSNGKFLGQFGSFGTGPGQFWSAFGIAVDRSGNVYVSDGNVQKFDNNGNYIGEFVSSTQITSLGLGAVGGVASDSSGNVYVGSISSHIAKFDNNGKFLTLIGSSFGPGPGQIGYAVGVAVDSTGNVFIADDSSNSRIAKFRPSTISVILPAVDVSFNTVVTYHSDALPLTFTQETSTDPRVLFNAVSNTGMLSGIINFYGLPTILSSSTTATVNIYPPGSFSSLPARQYSAGIIVNGSLLNGPFDSSHYYMEWDSPGFDVSLDLFNVSSFLTLFGRSFTGGHLTFWVDLSNLMLSPASNSTAVVLQGAESYLHTELSRYYILPEMIGAISIDNSQLAIIKSSSIVYNRLTNLTTQTITVRNISTFTFEGPIQIVLADLSPSSFVYVFSPHLPYFLTDPYITAPVSTLAPGASINVSFSFYGAKPVGFNYIVHVYSGTFLF
jgi:streptogramin lyase